MRWHRRRETDADARREREEALASARQQLHDSEHEREAVQERTSEFAEIARTLRRLREQNHFAPLVLEAFGGDQR